MKEQKIFALCQALQYSFTNLELLQTALTHRSAASKNNERLEFLGDALLSFIIAEDLFQRFPQAREGDLTRFRSGLVKGDTLAEIAQQLDIGSLLILGGGELKSGGWRRKSILADAMEAIIGAVYLDGGIEACKPVVLQLLHSRLAQLSLKKVEKDPKTLLQEYLQARQQDLPDYRVLSVEGDPHEQYFSVECQVAGLAQAPQGDGNNRRYAEQMAAAKALDLLKQQAKS